MKFVLEVHDGKAPIGRTHLDIIEQDEERTIFATDLLDLARYFPTPTRRRRRGGTGPRILERLLDPEADRPILKKLMQTVAPIALQFLTTQLPSWLSSVDLGKAFATPSDRDGE